MRGEGVDARAALLLVASQGCADRLSFGQAHREHAVQEALRRRLQRLVLVMLLQQVIAGRELEPANKSALLP